MNKTEQQICKRNIKCLFKGVFEYKNILYKIQEMKLSDLYQNFNILVSALLKKIITLLI